MSALQLAPERCHEQRVTIAEFILDGCGLTFSEGACSGTGVPCYNTFNTCPVKCDFECAAQRFWFTDCPTVPPQIVPQYVANIVSVSATPTTLEIGKAFSTRGRVKLCMRDAPHNDSGFDPYRNERHDVIPICPEDMPGTLLSRWIQRVKYFENRRVNIYSGYTDQALCDFTKQSYFIDRVEPAGSNGLVCFNLKDPLILADNKNAQCPRQENKLLATQSVGAEFPFPFTLAAQLDGLNDPDSEEQSFPFAQVGGFLLDNNYLLGDPQQDKCFTNLRHVCIGNEILEVRAVVNNATPRGWNIQLVNRGACGSEIDEHRAGEQIRLAETFEKQHIADVICRLLSDCAEIEEVAAICCGEEHDALIDYNSLIQLRCEMPMAYVSRIVCESTGITTLLNELSEQFLFFLHFDSTIDRIKFQAFRPPDCDQPIPCIRLCDYEAGMTVGISDERYNEIAYLHTPVDCSEDVDAQNSAVADITLQADALNEPCARRTWKTRRRKQIESGWIDGCNAYLAKANAERWAMVRECPPETVRISTSFRVGNVIELGSFVNLEHPQLQDIHGNPTQDLFFVKSKTTNSDCTQLQLERAAYFNDVVPCFDCDSDCAFALEPADDCEGQCTGVW